MALLDWMSDVAGPVVRGDGVLLRPPLLEQRVRKREKAVGGGKTAARRVVRVVALCRAASARVRRAVFGKWPHLLREPGGVWTVRTRLAA